MKSILKRIQIISLIVLVGFGATSITNGTSLQNTTNKQYVLSSCFPKQNLNYSQKSKQAQSNIIPTSVPSNTKGSSNWAGYIATPNSNSGYTSVSGSWTIPNISANQRNAVAAQWIGLGGVTSSDLLQMGTIEQIENGQPMAEVFWEKLPDVAQNVISVPIGSTIDVNISNSSNSTWDLTFTANTSDGQKQTKTISTTLDSSYAQGIGTSAEWISEDPSNGNNQLVPLANMGTVKYQSALVNGQPLNASVNNVQPIALVSNNGAVLISPSALGDDNESFTTISNSTTLRHGVTRVPKPMQRRIVIRFRWNK